jgi:hypothetical protein
LGRRPLLNVNADDGAAGLAARPRLRLGLSPMSRILDEHGRLIPVFPSEITRLIDRTIIKGA